MGRFAIGTDDFIDFKEKSAYFDTTKTMSEAVYQFYILGMLIYLDKDYYCGSNPVFPAPEPNCFVHRTNKWLFFKSY